MSTRPLAITATGMVTGVGLDAPNSCAAIRAAIDNFQETRFMDTAGEWIQGCEAPLDQPWRGITKLCKILVMALRECAANGGIQLSQLPLFICLAEEQRPGRIANLEQLIYQQLKSQLGIEYHPQTRFFAEGRVGGLTALHQARQLIYQQGIEQILIAGVDSLLSAQTVQVFEERERILTSVHSNGFIPGEAASALLVSRPKQSAQKQLLLIGQGFAMETVTIDSDDVFKAAGMTAAVKAALTEAGIVMDNIDCRIVDVAGEQYGFKEAALVIAKLYRGERDVIPIWHPSDCIGEVGAATAGVAIAYLKTAFEKEFDEGQRVLQHCANDDGKRGAAVFYYDEVDEVKYLAENNHAQE